MSNEKCTYCGGYRSRGAPHDEGYIFQWECLGCGKIEGVSKSNEGYHHDSSVKCP